MPEISEYSLGFQAIAGMGAVVLSASLYMMGGRSIKALRRFGASLVLALAVNVLCLMQEKWSPLLLVLWPLLIGGFSMGYGADALKEKFTRRLLYCLGVCASGLFCAIVIGGNAWWLLIPHVAIGMFSIFLGIKNILPSAVEEVAVCIVLTLFLVFYPFV